MTDRDFRTAGLDSQTTTTSPALDTIGIMGLGAKANNNTDSNLGAARNEGQALNNKSDATQVAGIFDFLFEKPKEKEAQEAKQPDWMKVISANDEKSVDLSKQWLDLSKKANDPASRKAADAALTSLADHLVAHKGNPSRTSDRMPTMSDNHGFSPPFTSALEADTKSYTMIKALVDRYNERSEAAKFPGRMEFKLDDRKDGNRVVEVRRYDPRPAVELPNKQGMLSPDNMTLRYRLKPGD